MAFLNLSTYGDVPVDLDAGSAQLEPEVLGSRRRSVSGVMHSSIRKRFRRWRVRLKRVPRLQGDLILAALDAASPIGCSGDLIDPHGDSVTSCYVEMSNVSHPKHADDEYQLIEFLLIEVDETAGLLLFQFRGDAPGRYTFTRTGATSNAWAPDENGIYQQASGADVPRFGYVDLGNVGNGGYGPMTDRAYMQMPAATNLILDSADIDPDDANWSENAPWTQAAAVALFAGKASQKFTGDGATADHLVATVNHPDLTAVPLVSSLIIENVDALTTRIGIYDNSVGDWVVLATYTWATGAIVVNGSGAGTADGARARTLAEFGPNNGKVVRLEVYATPSGAGLPNGGDFFIYPVGSAASTLSAILHHAQHETGVIATDPIVTDGSSKTRPGELLYVPVPLVPVAMTVMADIIIVGSLLTTLNRLWDISDAANLSPRVLAYLGAPGTVLTHHQVSASAAMDISQAVTYAHGDRLRVRSVLYADGSVRQGNKVGSGAETASAQSSALGRLATAWSAGRLYPGGAGGVTPIHVLSITGARGEQTMATMETLAKARPHALLS